MAVEYNSSAEFHLNKIREAELARTMARKKGGAAALRAQNLSTSTPGPDDAEQANSPRPSEVPETPARNTTRENKRPASPASSSSSDSEPPLAQTVPRMNGSSHGASVPPVSTSSHPPSSHAPPPVSQSAPPLSSGASASSATAPPWLMQAIAAMRAKYPDDLFVLKRINGTEWRVKCTDCPGKVRLSSMCNSRYLINPFEQLYTPGPGDTLSNYEVHLKNRNHRQKVNDRKNNIPPSS